MTDPASHPPAAANAAQSLDPVAALAASIPADDTSFATSVLRARSVAGRDVLARLATGGSLSDHQLRAFGLAGHERAFAGGGGSELPEGVDRRWLAVYAHTLGVQLGDAEDQRAALGLLHGLAESGHALIARDAEVYAQLLLADGQREAAAEAGRKRAVRTVVRTQIAADVSNPHLITGADPTAWLAALNDCLIRPGLTRLALRSEGATPFDRLVGAQLAPGSVRGPLVAIIMSAYNPDHTLLTAVRSVIDQTYADWELLIVDDASPNPQPGVLDHAAGMDPRVRVIRKAVNGGTYRARNTALRQTNADFFTCLDSDDWAHPQRLELGVAPLLATPALMATRSMCVRADENLLVSRPGHHGFIINAPSLLVRMHPAVARLGFFDIVRKAADTEYAVRLENAFGVPVLTLKQDVLTMARHQAGSLSFGEFTPGWRHEARNAYRQAYAPWHATIRGGGDPFLDPDAPRRIPAPRRWQAPIDPRLAEPTPFEVVLCDDLRAGAPGAASAAATLSACLAAQLRVGVLHVENLWAYAAKESPLDPAVQAHIAAGAVERIYLEDAVAVDTLVVPTPEVLQFPPWATRVFHPTRVLVATAGTVESGRPAPDPDVDPGDPVSPTDPVGGDPAPVRPDPARFEEAAVARHTRALFGVDPIWVPFERLAGPGVARDLAHARSAQAGATIVTARQAAAELDQAVAAGAPMAWLTIAQRRPGDGSSADSLALRHVATPLGEAAAWEALRAALPAVDAAEPLDRDAMARLIRPGVDAVAQLLSGHVERWPPDSS